MAVDVADLNGAVPESEPSTAPETTAAPAAPAAPTTPPNELDDLFAASPPATGAPTGGEAGPGVSAPAPAPAAPQPWEQQIAQVQQYGAQLATTYQQLQAEEARDQQLIQRLGSAVPAEVLQQIQQDQAARVQAYAQIQRAANALELQHGQALLAQREAQFRQQYEPIAEHVTLTELVAAAQRRDPTIDATEMREYLKGFGADVIIPAAQKFFRLHTKTAAAQRAADGTDYMGGTGSTAPPTDFSKLDPVELFKMEAAAIKRRR